MTRTSIARFRITRKGDGRFSPDLAPQIGFMGLVEESALGCTAQGLRAGAFALAALICGGNPLRGAQEPLEIRVRAYDYVRVPSRDLWNAKRAAADLLAEAGVIIVWADCRINQSEPPKDALCGSPLTPLDLNLRIVDREMATAAGTSHDSFGYALLWGGKSFVAVAYYGRAIDMEMSNMASRSAVLGGIIVHEMGHVVLGDARHATSGIMLADWGRRELKRISEGRLRFSAEQAQRIRRSLAARAASGARPAEVGHCGTSTKSRARLDFR